MARRAAEKLEEVCIADDIVSTLLAIGFEDLPHDLARQLDHGIVGPVRVAQVKRPPLLFAPQPQPREQLALVRHGGRGGRGRGR